MRSPAVTKLPETARLALSGLAANLRTARLRRRWTVAAAARQTGLNLRTYMALEAGHPGASLGVLVAALTALGLEGRLPLVLEPTCDGPAIELELERLPRSRRPLKVDPGWP